MKSISSISQFPDAMAEMLAAALRELLEHPNETLARAYARYVLSRYEHEYQREVAR